MSKNTGTSELINYFDLGANGDVGIAGSLDVNTIANATTDTDRFLVSDTGIIKYRTGAELLSDIGAAPATGGSYLPLAGGTLTGALNGTSSSFTGNIITSAGFFNFANNYGIQARNFQDTAYRTIFKLNTSNQVEIGRSTDISDIILGTASATNALTITSTGSATFSSSVGINGVYSPAAELQVGKSSDVTIAMSNYSSVTSGIRGGIAWYNSSVSTVANIRAVAVTDNVGTELQFYTRPATGSLTQVLTLASTGAATFSSSIAVGGAGLGLTGINLPNQNYLAWYASGTSGPQYVALRSNGSNLELSSGGGLTMTLDASQRVGIGTASPGATLEVRGGTGANLRVRNNGSNNLLLQNYNDTDFYKNLQIAASTIQLFTGDDGGTGTTERMRIISSGFLKVSNNGSYQYPTNNFHSIENSIADWICALTNKNASSPSGLLITYNGAAPNNFSNNFLYAQDNSVARFVAYSNGGIGNYQANNLNLSDERTKKDIEPLESYWDKFKAIEIVKFKYKDQTHDDYNIGVIAQQVETVAPEFVDVDGWDTKPEGNKIVSKEEPLKAIYTADLYHATIKVLQEAMAKIEKLETEIDKLKNK